MLRRTLLALLIALLGLGTVLHGVQASEMGVAMAMAPDGGDAPPCDGSDSTAGGLAACATACGAVTALPGPAPFRLLMSVEAAPRRDARLGERPGNPPDPFPPRFPRS